MSLLSRLAVQAARAYGMLVAGSANNVSAEYLVVAGGGGGGRDIGGGGGAGGLLASTATLSTLNTYSITVGGGGAGSTVVTSKGVNGSNSVISGTGLTTITSIGGGGGGSNDPTTYTGNTGGSGGGSSALSTTSPSGTAGQGNSGGAGNNNLASGGGGGAGAAGTAGSGTSASGNGGNGSASSISGSSVTYAGGGGGGGYSLSASVGTGGTGGGGDGVKTGTAVSGTVNLGGGGGGGGTAGGAGGSGIVIISYTSATPKFVGGTITTSGGKQIHTFTSSGTLSPVTPITASYLVVAGGGGGGAERNGGGSGGGGAGGYQTSSTTLYSGATYVVTVGGGGAGAAAANPANSGTQGSNSVLSGTGITTITSTGGGFGGAQSTSTVGGNGGSGGGGWSGGASPPYAGGTGTSGQGNNGGSGNTTGNTGGGGGGGASAVGGSWSGTNGSNNGGAGTASSITGTSVTYAGGGGGGVGAGTASTGGTGGGGAGGSGAGGHGTSGTPNLGGGGGGAGGNNATPGAGGSGGSGVVIISYAGSQQFNGGLVTSSGGNTIHTFTSTGALTPLTNNLNNSLRFRSSASAYLNRTPASASNRKTWTWSGWVKKAPIQGSANTLATLMGCTTGSTDSTYLRFGFYQDKFIVGNNSAFFLQSTSLYRDPSAWYHVVVSTDTNQGSASNRMRVYINGNEVTAWSTDQRSTYLTSSVDLAFNQASQHSIGSSLPNAGDYYDGYMTDINFIDGQALEPYYFGNNDANGVWKPIQYKGTYGTNGFYLTFGNTTSTTTLGYDSSPNGNNWTCNNISLTAGTTYDAMTDVPTNTSATVANYPVMTPAYLPRGSYTLSEANLKCSAAYASSNYPRIMSSMGMTSGKYYWEYVGVTFPSTESCSIGIKEVSSAYPSATGGLGAVSGEIGLFNTGRLDNNGSTTSSFSTSFTTGDVIGMAFDATNSTLNYYKNGSAIGSQITGIAAGTYAPAFDSLSTSQTVWNVNYGQRPFAYTPPTGFVALNTFNLPTPTILQGNKYMDATLYTGQGVVQTVVNAGQFRPDFVWQKPRNEVASHRLVDSVRGVNNVIYSNQTAAQSTETTTLTAFNSNGFTGGGSNAVTSGNNAVAWQWQAGQGSTSSNTSGSITTTTSVSTTAGFSIIQFTGTQANATIGHGLGAVPRMVIVKTYGGGTRGWRVYHASIGNTGYLILNDTSTTTTDSTAWNNTTPTSTVISLGANGETNNGGSLMIAYAWAEIAGFSRFGSYTGGGNTGASTPNANGPFVYLGFRPKFVLIKRTSSAAQWVIYDSVRGTFNANYPWLYPNATDAETATEAIDFLSNGFKIRSESGVTMFPDGATFIYAAFAENPFKNSNAR